MDSKSASCSAKNPLYHKRSKYIDIKYHWIKEKIMGGSCIVRLKPVGTEYIDADIFTKALDQILLIQYAARVIGLKELEEDKE